ncbi:hypothetical protein GP486_006298 [Trichoglossum hirsutum]|uniref:Uncharacterized protein n=1 Tax=Trichoglossum hirsutum TaxID=265104 RepID=A0A9P8IDT9_9PEZI|nr:hypothetical protein GP486_006298 [Trichoglossum hirsutum]
MASSETDSLNFTFQMRPSFPPEPPSYRPPIPPIAAGAHKFTISFSATQPPLGDCSGPTGRGAQFQYTRQAQAMAQSPQLSSPSSMSSMRSTETPEILDDRQTGNSRAPNGHTILVEESSFILEELRDSDMSGDSDVEVVRPDHYEEVDSDWDKGDGDTSAKRQHASWQDELEQRTGIVRDFQGLCSGSDGFNYSLNHADQDRRHRHKKNRWNASIFKRSFSQTIASETDGEDEADMNANGVGSSTRRLRRRVGSREPGTRSPLAFENSTTSPDIAGDDDELDIDDSAEPDDSDEYIMGTLPFWVMADMMQVDSDTDHQET